MCVALVGAFQLIEYPLVVVLNHPKILLDIVIIDSLYQQIVRIVVLHHFGMRSFFLEEEEKKHFF